MKKIKYLSLVVLIAVASACSPSKKEEKVNEVVVPEVGRRAKFEPADGKIILFAGQELEAIGGLKDYNDGYFDHFTKPGGFTMYTKIEPGTESFGFTITGLCGINSTDDWGDGPSNLNLQLANENFKDVALAIGLEFTGHEKAIEAGERDSLVIALGQWIKGLGRRPVFLRVGYEFDGPWNAYDKTSYINCFKKIKNMYDSMQVENIAYVWQSKGFNDNVEALEEWYPGDDYVDWCSFSFFHGYKAQKMVDFAKKHNKPVFIAEATPTISDTTSKVPGKNIALDMAVPEQAQLAWDEWFIPYFKLINENPEVIKGISYINSNWKSRPMWKDNVTFQQVDARLQLSPEISKKWTDEVYKDNYLQATPDLFDYLWNDK